MRNMHYADVKANGCNATAIQFAMEFYHIFFSHTVVFTLARTEIIYPKNVGALVAMNFT